MCPCPDLGAALVPRCGLNGKCTQCGHGRRSRNGKTLVASRLSLSADGKVCVFLCMFACVCARAYLCVYVCVCVSWGSASQRVSAREVCAQTSSLLCDQSESTEFVPELDENDVWTEPLLTVLWQVNVHSERPNTSEM